MLLDTARHQVILIRINMTLSRKRLNTEKQMTIHIKFTYRYSIILLGEPKYGPGSEPHWKAGSAHYPDFYKALLKGPSRTKRIEMVRAHMNEYI